MQYIAQRWSQLTTHLEFAGTFMPQLGIRLILAYEFWEAGYGKLHGDNWFADIQSSFPFPLNLMPVEFSWHFSTWFELVGAAALLLGLATRFFSAGLIVLTLVAWAAVHAGNGYNVCDNGYKLPLIYLVMLAPMLFSGAGKLSVDHFIQSCAQSGAGFIGCMLRRG